MISMALATKPGWCCCCRRPDRPACGGRPQSKNCWNRRIHCRSVSLWCGSQSCRQIGRDPAEWFNPESQTQGSSSIGITTILSRESCAVSFPRSQAAAAAKAYLGLSCALWEPSAVGQFFAFARGRYCRACGARSRKATCGALRGNVRPLTESGCRRTARQVWRSFSQESEMPYRASKPLPG